MYSTNNMEMIGTVRRPIQCEGIERGPKRIAEVAVSGSMNPQWGLSDLWNTVAPVLGQVVRGVLA